MRSIKAKTTERIFYEKQKLISDLSSAFGENRSFKHGSILKKFDLPLTLLLSGLWTSSKSSVSATGSGFYGHYRWFSLSTNQTHTFHLLYLNPYVVI